MGLVPCRRHVTRYRRMNNQTIWHKSTICPASHQNSDLTLRLHNLQTAQFTEHLKEHLRPLVKDRHSYFRALPDTMQDLKAQRKPSFTSLSAHARELTGLPQTSMIDDPARSIRSKCLSDLCVQDHHAYHRDILDIVTETSQHNRNRRNAYTCSGLSLFTADFADKPTFTSSSPSSREKSWRAETYFTRQGFHPFQTCARTSPRTDPAKLSISFRMFLYCQCVT